MKLLIPCLYMSYGRYINKFRAIPSDIDGLKLVERRVLLTLNDTAKSLVKSAKVVGNTIAQYHPHGDASVYGTLVNMVENGYAEGKGGWGTRGLEDNKASAYRYTECKIEKWFSDKAFKYIDHVPWVNIEYNEEPIALPCPIPVGLIGYDVSMGISFYRTLIPKYKATDLAIRLKWLLENNKPDINKLGTTNEQDLESIFGPCIKPNFRDCQSKADIKEFYKILLMGEGSISAIPNGSIDKKNNRIYITGRAPGYQLTNLKNASILDPKTKTRELEVSVNDESADLKNRYFINVLIEPLSKKENLNNLAAKIWNNYLIKTLNFSCYFSDNDGILKYYGIDDILINNYNFWKNAVLIKKWKDCERAIRNKFDNIVVQIIRDIFERYKFTKVEDIVNQYITDCSGIYKKVVLDHYDDNLNIWTTQDFEVLPDNIISIAKEKSIRQLIETKIDIPKLDNKIQECKLIINNNDIDCFNEVVLLTK